MVVEVNLRQMRKGLIRIFFAFLLQLIVSKAFANPANAPEAPLDHCYHWIKENQGYLSFKYQHAEKTGGEFTFYTSQGNHAAGDGIYCSKTLIGSYTYGDRVVRIDFAEDTVFRTVDGRNVCFKESGIQDCAARVPDVISYSLSSGWYVIKRPDVIYSWSANSDQLRADFTEEKVYKTHDHLLKALALMDLELLKRPKNTYFNPKARKSFLKLIASDQNIGRLASDTMIFRVLNLTNLEISEERKVAVLSLAIQTMADAKKFQELLRVYARVASYADLQQLVYNKIREGLTPEFVRGLDVNSMLLFDAVFPEFFHENEVKIALENTLRSNANLDEILAIAVKSDKLRPLIGTVVFDELKVSRLRNKSSILVALKNTVAQGTLQGNPPSGEKLFRSILVAMSTQFSFSEILDSFEDSQLMSNANIPFLFKYFFESRHYLDYQAPQILDILSRLYSKVDSKLFLNQYAVTLENLAETHWLEIVEIALNQSYLAPDLGKILPTSMKSLSRVTASPIESQRMIKLQKYLMSRAKPSAKELAYLKGSFELLVQANMCSEPAGLDFSALDDSKAYPIYLKEALISLLNKKESGFNSSNCSIIAFASAMDRYEKKIPVDLNKRLWAQFDAIPLIKDKLFDIKLKKEFWSLNSQAEWKVTEKILGFVINNCKNTDSACNLEYSFSQYFYSYFIDRYVEQRDDNSHATSRFVARTTDFLLKRASPAAAWIAFEWESRMYKFDPSESLGLRNFLSNYGNPKTDPIFKRRFETIIDYAFNSNLMQFVTLYSQPNYKPKAGEENLIKGSQLVFARIMNFAFKTQFSYLLKQPNYEAIFRLREPTRYKNIYCDFVSNGLSNRNETIAFNLRRPLDEVAKELKNLYEASCESK